MSLTHFAPINDKTSGTNVMGEKQGRVRINKKQELEWAQKQHDGEYKPSYCERYDPKTG